MEAETRTRALRQLTTGPWRFRSSGRQSGSQLQLLRIEFAIFALAQDVTLAYLKGKDAESEENGGTCEQQQPGDARIDP